MKWAKLGLAAFSPESVRHLLGQLERGNADEFVPVLGNHEVINWPFNLKRPPAGNVEYRSRHGVILTAAGKVNEQSRLCQSYKGTTDVREILMPDKLRAVERLAKLCGFNEPEGGLVHGCRGQPYNLLFPNCSSFLARRDRREALSRLGVKAKGCRFNCSLIY